MTTRLFHVSDIHFGVEDRSALDAVVDAIRTERPDALVCTGDLTQRAKHSEYAAAADWFRSLSIPVWIDPGNHDMPYFNPIERFTKPYQRFNALRAEIAVSSYETDDVVLVPLKSTVRSQSRWPWSDGVITPSALDRTLRELHPLANDPRTVIVTAHHPLLGPKDASSNPTIEGDAAFVALSEAGMNAALSGHVHHPIDEWRGEGDKRAQLIGAGTLSTRLRHGAPPSYNVLICKRGEAVEVERRDLRPGGR